MSHDEGIIKHTLDFILEQTFENYKDYTSYFVVIQPKELKSKHGHYESKEAKIVIFNLSREHEHTLLTCLHELAHHVEFCDNGETGHEESFYLRYFELLKTALSYQYLTSDDIETEKDSNDFSNLCGYFGHPSTWQYVTKQFEGKIIFSIFTDPKHKSYLKNRGYRWFTLAQRWQKTCENRAEAKQEYQQLISVIPKEDITTKNTGKVEFLAFYYIGVLNGYDFRNDLERMGYLWEGYGVDKAWVKRVEAQKYYEEVLKLTQFAGIEYKKVMPDLEKERRKLKKIQDQQKRRKKRVIIVSD